MRPDIQYVCRGAKECEKWKQLYSHSKPHDYGPSCDLVECASNRRNNCPCAALPSPVVLEEEVLLDEV